MYSENLEEQDIRTVYNDKLATLKDLRILSLELGQTMLELEQKVSSKINSMVFILGSLIIGCSSILFGLLQYFHK
jgi:hypothetical protein